MSWVQIAQILHPRTAVHCRNRYVNKLSPLIVKKVWNEEDDALLIAMQRQHKNKWSAMTQYFSGSTANAIKNRFNLLKRDGLTEDTTKSSQGSCLPI